MSRPRIVWDWFWHVLLCSLLGPMQAILILAVAGFIWLPVGAILGQAHPEVVLGAALILLMGLPIEMVLCLVGLLVLGVPVSLLWRRVLLGRHGVWLAGAFGAVAGVLARVEGAVGREQA